MRWTHNDSLAFDAVSRAGQGLRDMWAKKQAGDAYAQGSKVQEGTESSYGAVDPGSVYTGPNADGAMTNAEAASYGLMAPESTKKQYSMAGGAYTDTAPTEAQRRASGLNAVADYHYKTGDVDRGADAQAKAMALETGEMSLREKRRLEAKTLKMDEIAAKYTKIGGALNSFDADVKAGKMSPADAVAKIAPDYNANVDDGMFIHVLPNGQVAYGPNAADKPARVVSAEEAWKHIAETDGVNDYLMKNMHRALAMAAGDPESLSRYIRTKQEDTKIGIENKKAETDDRRWVDWAAIQRENQASNERIHAANRLSHERSAAISAGPQNARVAMDREMLNANRAVTERFSPLLEDAQQKIADAKTPQERARAESEFNAIGMRYRVAQEMRNPSGAGLQMRSPAPMRDPAIVNKAAEALVNLPPPPVNGDKKAMDTWRRGYDYYANMAGLPPYGTRADGSAVDFFSAPTAPATAPPTQTPRGAQQQIPGVNVPRPRTTASPSLDNAGQARLEYEQLLEAAQQPGLSVQDISAYTTAAQEAARRLGLMGR